jgi:cyclophilin family peptidyl-prolyl cis-trans isomerase/HEAT repeat protein
MTRAGHVVILLAAITASSSAQTTRQRPSAEPLADEMRRRILILAIEDGRNPTGPELKLLTDLARGEGAQGTVRPMAMRALGRLERRDVIPVLLTFMQDARLAVSAASALVPTLRAHAGDGTDPQVNAAIDAVLRVPKLGSTTIAYLPYGRPEQVAKAEGLLMAKLKDSEYPVPPFGQVASGLEVLARVHRKLVDFGEETIEFLEKCVLRAHAQMPADESMAPKAALAALAALGKVEADHVRAALRDRFPDVRRVGVIALGGGGLPLEPSVRTDFVESALRDTDASVRYEALRVWTRREAKENGCGPVVTALSDDNVYVALAAIDALGDVCNDDEAITNRIASEARTPPTVGEWHRQAHAFVALAKRAPDRIPSSMEWFAGHAVWQVRMYAARAAVVTSDRETLRRLAFDAEDNVREAALPTLLRLDGRDSIAAFVAAFARPDYQLLRTAANALKAAPPNAQLVTAMVEALQRVTAEKKDTSRDTRTALLDRILAMAGRGELPLYERLLKDFDPEIAGMAAQVCTGLSTTPCVANPQPLRRPAPPTPDELNERVRARVELDNGRSFTISLNRDGAPLAVVRFVRLIRARYYNGLTFHRVVPNFVIQGGSPGANEYVGDGPFMRDEVGGLHHRGAVGISTRGRDTGDAQIFVNLVDNARLSYEYTVMGTISDDDMEIVDRVVEGTRIRQISLIRQ